MPNVNNNEEFVRWILEAVPFEDIMTFMQQGNIMVEAMEYFNNDWCDYCDANATEPDFPYEVQIWSEPTVIFIGDETEVDIPPGTIVTVVSEDIDTLRGCEWNGNRFWLEIEEIRYGNN
jgi:hypothetical protein